MATISLLPSGRWQAKIRKKGFRISNTLRTKQLAQNWAKRIEDDIDIGVYAKEDKGGVLWGDIIDKYIREITVSKKSFKIEKYILVRFKQYFNGMRPSQIKSTDILGYVAWRSGEELKPATLIKDLNKISHVFDTAITLGWIESQENPVKQARKVLNVNSKLREDNARNRRLTDSEREILLASRLGSIVEFALETAMRRGEICRIDECIINESRSVLTIPASITKTGKARTIPLSAKALELALNSDQWFTKAPQGVSRNFHEICVKFGIEDLRFHDLRHEATSTLFEKGLAIQEVAMITGHTSWSSLKRYTHLSADDIVSKL